MSISLRELNPKDYPLTEEQSANLKVLHTRINIIGSAYNKPMTVTSGVRSIEHHKRVYQEKATKAGLTSFKVPMGSNHLKGSAVDIADSDGQLKQWILQNIPLLEVAGLWCEDFNYTNTWVHFQTVQPKSGKRFFIP